MVVNDPVVVLLESWLPVIGNFIEESDVKVSLHMFICEIVEGRGTNLFLVEDEFILSGMSRVSLKVASWQAQLHRFCAKSPACTGLPSPSGFCADHACHRHVCTPCSCRKKVSSR